MAANEPADPQKALQKYTYPNAAADDAAISKVETAIADHFPIAYTVGLVESVKDPPIKEAEVAEKKKEYDEKVAQAKHDHPEECKKEAQEGPPPQLHGGPAVKPAVKEHGVKTGDGKEPPKGAKGEGAKEPAPHGKPGATGGSKAVPAAPQELVLTAAVSGDADLDKWLDGYPQKDPETSERLSKIKEMGAIAKGFDGQVEGYVKQGGGRMESARSALTGLLGKKELGAAFGENPYQKVEGGLGIIMQGISRFQNVISIVGNVTGKIGMILTLVGLLAMIFPPLGAAVEAVARVLNTIGIICDAIGFVLSGVLTGLNGVVLAKQIAKGASNEEKAATADMMVTEATSAGGHILNLAMSYGPGFMKGFKGASTSVIGQVFARVRSSVGRFASKALGPVANWAKNATYKMGIGLEKTAKAEGPGLLTRGWKSPATLLKKARDSRASKWVSNTRIAQAAGRGAARIDRIGWVNKVDGLGEKMGAGLNTMANRPTWKAALETGVENDVRALATSAEHNAARDARNRESSKIERDIKKSRDAGNHEYVHARGEDGALNDAAALKSRTSYETADALEAGKGDAIAKAEQRAAEDAKRALENKEAKRTEGEAKAAEEDQRNEAFKKDPTTFQAETRKQEAELAAHQQKLKDPNLADAEKTKLKGETDELADEVDERRLTGLKASGGESAETMWQAKEVLVETWAAMHGKDENAEKAEARTKQAELRSGHVDSEKIERGERHEHMQEWAEHEAPMPTASEQVEGLLAGLDEDIGSEGDDRDDDAQSDDARSDGPASTDPQSREPDAASAGVEPSQAPPPQATPAPAPGPAPEPQSELPELVYWPRLAGPGGEFAQAAKDLQRMKQLAYGFHKSQIEAKHKAMEAFVTFSSSADLAAQRQQHAAVHTGTLQSTIDEARTASASADQGTARTQEGANKQNEGRGNANGKAQETPDVGEKPGRLHPIKRIWWSIKKWASDKAAWVFGMIQEKIASLVLKGICGVSMGDMKAYTTALHHRMEFSKVAGAQGVSASTQAMADSAKASTDSKTYAMQAMEDATACDQNISDSEAFMKSVEATEQDVAAEQARATQFIQALKAAVVAERARLKEAEAKKAADGLKALVGADPASAASGAAGSTPQSSVVAAPRATKPDTTKQKPVSAAAVIKVQSAAQYVANQASVLVVQLTSSRTEQTDRLKASVEKRSKAIRADVAKHPIGEGVIAGTRLQTTLFIAAMEGISSSSPASNTAVRGAAGRVKSEAHALDEVSTGAHDALNLAFKSAYDSIANLKAAG